MTTKLNRLDNMHELTAMIILYYDQRNLKVPSFYEAMAWATIEEGEAYEAALSQGDWVRNHPENHPPKTVDDLGEELGDTIMMLIVAGLVQGIDPIRCLEKKLIKRLRTDDNQLLLDLKGL